MLILRDTEEAFERLLSLVQQYDIKGKAIHDAQVVASMLANGVTHLVTYNRSDFQRYGEVALESPPLPGP
ncbi:MAG: type II toxin-antitoxin system VapC family toxin [Rhodothermales bacterium]